MKKRIVSLLLVMVMLLSNVMGAYAISSEENGMIDGNTIWIGDHLFELNKHGNTFNLNNFMNAVRSIDNGSENAVYYKAADGKWYNIVKDEAMNAPINPTTVSNKITVRNGVKNNTDPTKLTSSDLIFSPAKFVESSAAPGTFDSEITVSIKDYHNAKFASNIDGRVDAISSATLVKTGPEGTNVTIKRVDDKNLKLTMSGVAKNHDTSINKTEGSGVHQKDYNGNGIYGDMKFLMLKDFFTSVNSVEDDGQYVVLDMIYTDDVVQSNDIIHNTQSKMVTIENVDYGVLVLNQGNINDYNFFINDAKFNPTKVNDSGTVVKFEMNRKEVAAIKVIDKTNQNRVDSINIGTGTENFSGVVVDQDPDRILVSGPVSYFDYYLVDYDDNGVIRNILEKTTFDTVNEGVKPVDTTVPVMTFEKTRTPLGENIVINVAEPSSVKSKKWLANVYEVLKNYETSAASRVPLEFNVDKDAGKVTILAKSTAIDDRNGIHKIVLKSNGFNDIHMTFELVEPAGELFLSPNFNWWAENELLFELQDFNYAVTNPIYEVYLDGEKLQGDCEEYHVISNLIRLENKVIPKLTLGQHTIVVKIHGFEDYTKTFTLEKAPSGASNPTMGSPDDEAEKSASVDVVSAATGASGGVSGGSSGGSSGGGAIRANVIYNFDHLVNAFILTDLNMNTPYSDKLINWWHSFTKDAIIKDGSEVLVEYVYYKNMVGINGKYDTFAELHETMPDKYPNSSETSNPDYKKPAGLYVNRPYNVKNMLHDAVMGDIYPFGEVTATPAPVLNIQGEAKFGEDLVIKYTGEKGDEWAEELINVKMNSNYLKFEANKDNDTITFKSDANSIGTGVNTLKFTSGGFTTASLSVELTKDKPMNITATMDDQGQIIVGNFTADFMKEIKGVYLGAKGLFRDEHVGGNSGSYHFVEGQIVLRASIFGSEDGQFAKDKQHVFKVSANGYDDFVLNITPSALSGGSVSAADVPDYIVLSSENTYRSNNDVKIVVETMMNHDYKNKLQSVWIDGVQLDSKNYSYSFNDLVIKGAVFSAEKAYEVKLVAADYKEKVFTVTVDDSDQAVPNYVSFDAHNTSVEMGEPLILKFDDGQIGTSDYAKAVTKVVIGSKEYSVTATDTFDISSKVSAGVNNITVKATNYVDKVFTVTMTEAAALAKWYIDGEKDEKTQTLSSVEAVYVALGYYNNDIYKDNIQQIIVDGNVLADGFSYEEKGNQNVLKLAEKHFASGTTHQIEIVAEGYTKATLTLVVEAQDAGLSVPEDVKLIKAGVVQSEETMTLVSKPDEIKIQIDDSQDETAYETALKSSAGQIVVNGHAMDTTSDHVKDESSKRILTIDTSSITEDTMTIVLKAEGYKNKTFVVTIDPDYKEAVPSHVGIYKSYGITTDSKTVEKGVDVNIIVDDHNTPDTYKDAITGIKIVNGDQTVNKTRSDLSVGDNLVVDSEWLELGTNNITVQSTGFVDYNCTIVVTKKNVPSVVKVEGASTETVTYQNSRDVKIIVGDLKTSSEKAYIDAITTVKINGSAISDYKTEDTSGIYTNKRSYVIPAKYFGADSTTTVTVLADGYNDAVFTIKVLASGSKLPVPDGVGHVNGYGSTYKDRLFITSEYKAAITKVTFNNEVWDSVNYNNFSSYINFSALYSSNGGKYGSGTYDIVIEADGYETYNGTIEFK